MVDDDFKSMSDGEIESFLRAAWEYEEHEPLEILGRITRTLTKLGKTIYLLTDLRKPENGAVLRNPYERPGLRQGVFVHRSEAERLSVTLSEEPWVKAQATLFLGRYALLLPCRKTGPSKRFNWTGRPTLKTRFFPFSDSNIAASWKPSGRRWKKKTAG